MAKRKPWWNLPRPHLSPSQVSDYYLCPYRYKLKNIDKHPSLTSAPLIEGSTGHKVLEVSNHHQVDHGEPLAKPDMLALWNDTFSDKRKEIEDWGEDTEEIVRERGHDLLSRFRLKTAKAHAPMDHDSIEKVIEMPIGGVPVKMVIDVVTEGGYIMDYKFVKRKKSSGEAASGIQLGTYAYAMDLQKVGFICLCKQTRKVETVKAVRTPHSVQQVANVYTSIAKAITKGSFPYADPSTWTCSQRYCGVWYACPQGGKR